jgi:hypothetical protein
MAEEQRRKILTLASVDTGSAPELADLYFEMYRELLRDALEEDADLGVVERLWRDADARAKRKY